MSVSTSHPARQRSHPSSTDAAGPDKDGPVFGLSRNLAVRLLSSAVMIPVTVLAIMIGDPWLGMLAALVAGRATWEWARLVTRRPSLHFGVPSGALAGGAVLVAAFGRPDLALVVAGLGALGFWLAGVARRLVRGTWLGLGILVTSVPAVAFLHIRAGEPAGAETVLWLVSAVVASDVGAYIAGRTIGGARVAPRISPNKTWAGCGGGLIGAMLVSGICAMLFEVDPLIPVIVAGAGVSVLAQAGDLCESALKRRFEVKDSGALIPGHGGLLDRLDGHFATLAVAGLVSLVWGQNLLLL